MSKKPKDGPPGTTDQSPRWEGPPETRPRGYLPPSDDPRSNPDAAGEVLKDSDGDLGDAFGRDPPADRRTDRIRTRAYEIWEREGRRHGSHEQHWHRAATEIDGEEADGAVPDEPNVERDS